MQIGQVPRRRKRHARATVSVTLGQWYRRGSAAAGRTAGSRPAIPVRHGHGGAPGGLVPARSVNYLHAAMSDDMTNPEPTDPIDPAEAPQTPDDVMREAARRIAALEAERDEFKDRWVRAEAETANVRARSRREVEETRLFAVQKFARDVVEAAENIRRGLDSLPPPAEGEPEALARIREGFAGVERSVLGLLERNGIRRDDPTGALFDPNLHQAMAEQPTAEHPPGTVLQSWTPVWTLNGRLLRPAMVVVAKAPDGAASGGAGARVDTTA